jgi:hypothetical protein
MNNIFAGSVRIWKDDTVEASYSLDIELEEPSSVISWTSLQSVVMNHIVHGEVKNMEHPVLEGYGEVFGDGIVSGIVSGILQYVSRDTKKGVPVSHGPGTNAPMPVMPVINVSNITSVSLGFDIATKLSLVEADISYFIILTDKQSLPQFNVDKVYFLYEPETGKVIHKHEIITASSTIEEEEGKARTFMRAKQLGKPVSRLKAMKVEPEVYDRTIGYRIDLRTLRPIRIPRTSRREFFKRKIVEEEE